VSLITGLPPSMGTSRGSKPSIPLGIVGKRITIKEDIKIYQILIIKIKFF
jgi:hypothetical protein